MWQRRAYVRALMGLRGIQQRWAREGAPTLVGDLAQDMPVPQAVALAAGWEAVTGMLNAIGPCPTVPAPAPAEKGKTVFLDETPAAPPAESKKKAPPRK